MNIRRAVESDFAAMWPIFQAVVTSGTTYVFAPETSYQDAFTYWFAPGVTSYVAEDAGQIKRVLKEGCLSAGRLSHRSPANPS